MIYWLLIVTLNSETFIESYATKAECEIRRAQVKIEAPWVNTTCLRMDTT
jgi:hypothetical protein